MKLAYTEGCTCTSLMVDGKEFNLDLTKEERFNVALEILKASTSIFIYVYEYYLDDNLFKDVYPEKENFDFEDDYWKEFDSRIDRFNTLPVEAQRRYAIYILNKTKDDWLTQDIFCNYLKSEGEGGYEYTCDDCGDSVYHYEIELNG